MVPALEVVRSVGISTGLFRFGSELILLCAGVDMVCAADIRFCTADAYFCIKVGEASSWL